MFPWCYAKFSLSQPNEILCPILLNSGKNKHIQDAARLIQPNIGLNPTNRQFGHKPSIPE
jgi:hypothetical protein